MKPLYPMMCTTIFALVLFASPAAAQVGHPWDKKLTGANRFIVLAAFGSQAVFDKETGLVWERAPSTDTFTPSEAQRHCNHTHLGDRFGWRLPTIQELASLVDTSQAEPALTNGNPFTNVITDDCYWSATLGDPQWSVSFGGTGTVTEGGCGSGDGKNVVWCVRGGQGVEVQN
jgi:Protein of unknown function (DUF1566)